MEVSWREISHMSVAYQKIQYWQFWLTADLDGPLLPNTLFFHYEIMQFKQTYRPQFKLNANPFHLYIILYTNMLISVSYSPRLTPAHCNKHIFLLLIFKLTLSVNSSKNLKPTHNFDIIWNYLSNNCNTPCWKLAFINTAPIKMKRWTFPL